MTQDLPNKAARGTLDRIPFTAAAVGGRQVRITATLGCMESSS